MNKILKISIQLAGFIAFLLGIMALLHFSSVFLDFPKVNWFVQMHPDLTIVTEKDYSLPAGTAITLLLSDLLVIAGIGLMAWGYFGKWIKKNLVKNILAYLVELVGVAFSVISIWLFFVGFYWWFNTILFISGFLLFLIYKTMAESIKK